MPDAQATTQAELAGNCTVLPVAEVIEIVREWVDLHARHLPNYAGAYLWAGITALPPDALFPLYRDLDVVVVLTQGAQDDPQEVLYRGLMLEVITKNLDEHKNAETVLASASSGPNMATTQILDDPTGIIAPLQQAVVAQYGRRRWVQARCDEEKAMAQQFLAAMRQAMTPLERLDAVWLVIYALSGLLAIAQLKRPTTRRTLALLGELLDKQGRPDLHEVALAVFGSVHMSRGDVEAILAQCAVAFDRSVEVYRTPTPFGFTIRPHLRPYVVEATQEMIDEGNHREAVFWLTANGGEAYRVLQNDAPATEKPAFAAQLQAIHTALGYTSAETWAGRVMAAEQLVPEVFRIADELVAIHPE